MVNLAKKIAILHVGINSRPNYWNYDKIKQENAEITKQLALKTQQMIKYQSMRVLYPFF
jgi:hypothetical protein